MNAYKAAQVGLLMIGNLFMPEKANRTSRSGDSLMVFGCVRRILLLQI
jgi:hypothetical protein